MSRIGCRISRKCCRISRTGCRMSRICCWTSRMISIGSLTGKVRLQDEQERRQE